MKQIGIIAATPGELHPLVREWPRTDHVHIGNVGGVECLAASEGMGGAAATRSFQAIRAASTDLGWLVSYGWAGALPNALEADELEAGAVYPVSEVIEARTGERFHSHMQQDGKALVTLDRVAGRDEKSKLAERYGASLVDMEAATVGRLARAHGLGFLCLRGVSDAADTELPDLNRFITRMGRLRTGALAMHALLRPGTWPALLELGRNSKAAAEALARALPDQLARARLIF